MSPYRQKILPLHFAMFFDHRVLLHFDVFFRLLLLLPCFGDFSLDYCYPVLDHNRQLRGNKKQQQWLPLSSSSLSCLWKALPRFQVVTGTKATLTLNSSEKGGDGGAPSECDNQCHSEKGGDGRNRCLNFIKIHGNGKSVKAMVVDECDSTMGCDSDHDYQPPRDSDHDYQPPCDSDHDYQPPCANNIVDASKAGLESIGSA
ncbi:hypothetical protein OIU84_016079 [Salix udensis]|uniref:Uncharacterized protein n=1 Tax=Salix udensis TaxID=889485 RepID=A0AAD6J8J1_9ROSI|nr:hypothetical protein OIU84_016079 [Salix udensis]